MEQRIYNAINNSVSKKRNANNAALNAARVRNNARATVSSTVGYLNEEAEVALKELNELQIECAERIAEAERRVREMVNIRRRTEATAKQLLKEENAQLKKIVAGKKNNSANNNKNNNNRNNRNR